MLYYETMLFVQEPLARIEHLDTPKKTFSYTLSFLMKNLSHLEIRFSNQSLIYKLF